MTSTKTWNERRFTPPSRSSVDQSPHNHTHQFHYQKTSWVWMWTNCTMPWWLSFCWNVHGKLLSYLKHLHPTVLKGLGKPFDAALEKKLPHPLQSRGLDCLGSSNFRLHSLSSQVSVALGAPTFQGLIHLRSNKSCHFWESGNILGWRANM